MANIQTYLQRIKSAIYGREVRDSIHDAIDAINTEVEEAHDEIDEFVQSEMDTTLTSTELPAQGKAVGDAIEDVVIASDTQPTSEFNQIWIDEDGETEYQVPTYSEFSEVKNALNDVPNIKMVEEDDADLYIADSRGNVLAQFANGHIQTKNFDSSVIKPTGNIEWKFSGSDILLAYGYNDAVDAVVVLNEGRANGLFDFAKLCSKPKDIPLSSLETTDLTVIWSSGTDMHAPFQFLAANNADGYHADVTSPSWVGGNHTLDQMGSDWKTASSKFVNYYADGEEVSSGNGKCNHFEIRWANGVQAYNTVKQGGGGRECLTEYHDMIFDGVRFYEQIRLVPIEAIKMKLWYGLQFVSWSSKYTNITFEDATNRQVFASADGNGTSGNPVTSGMLAWGDNDAIEVTIDTTFDLGKRTFYTGSQGAFTTSASKGYFTIIGRNDTQMIDMAADTNWFLRGSYRFFSV